MQAPTPPRPPLVPRPDAVDAAAVPAVAPASVGPQALDIGRSGPPTPPRQAASAPVVDRSSDLDSTWYGVTGEMAGSPAAGAQSQYASAQESPLVARYRASAGNAVTDKAAAATSARKRPSKTVLVVWIAGGTVVVAAVIVSLVLYLGAGSATLAPAPDEAAAMLPTRIAGLSVELDRHPRVLEDVPYRRDGAGVVVTDPKRSGAGGYAAAVVLEPAATRGPDFASSFETGLQSDGKVGEFSDTVFDAVGFRTAEVSGTPDVTRVWWYQPYRDAVVVVYASDEATGRRMVEAIVERNTT